MSRDPLSSPHRFMAVNMVPEQDPMLDLSDEDNRKVIQASWLVEDAFRGFSRLHPQPTVQAARLYKLYHRFQWFRRLTVLVLLFISYTETPFWCRGAWPSPCGDDADPMTPLTSGMLWLTPLQAYAIEVTCLVLSLLNDLILYHSLKSVYFARLDRLFILLVVLVQLLNATFQYVFTWTICAQLSPFFRLSIFLATYRTLRSTYVKMVQVLAEVHNILALLGIYLAFFAWIATILFQDTDEETIMPTFLDSVWQLLITLTTANFPDVMMPAYTSSRAYAIFFIVFVLFGLFFLLNLILAQVFSNFQQVAQAEAAQIDATRRTLLLQAFELLVTVQKTAVETPKRESSVRWHHATSSTTGLASPPSSSHGHQPQHDWIDLELTVCLFEELNHLHVASTRMKRKHMLELFHQLDSNQSGAIEVENFFDMCDVMGQYVKTYRKAPSEVDRFWPLLARRPAYQRLCHVVEHTNFETAVDALLVINGLVVVVEMSQRSLFRVSSAWEWIHTTFSALYVVELLLKVTTRGIRDYVHYGRNRFDAVITIASISVDIYAYIPNSYNDHTFVKLLMMVRMLRLLRLLTSIERFRVVLATAWAMVPIGKNLLLVMFCNMNIFALVGLQLFGGKISPGRLRTDPLFVNSSYAAAAGYAANNFNDVPSGMVTLFELLVVNNWYVIVDGHVLVTSVWARVFFVAFWLGGVLLTLNLIIASILDAFSREYVAARNENKQATPGTTDSSVVTPCHSPGTMPPSALEQQAARSPSRRPRMDASQRNLILQQLEDKADEEIASRG
ncbi:Aste57867_5953 [Aphanomyces stellatus]|uniref:Aste57867_5953 protein n=1 Tax=Aphanomyces stellatus TaxID=120398 RepID=A0A485KHM5_9STRA|nr:hypothetical protein As57867_005939 [Aphanomyces stellatus]VFT82970.1 Aste57867_5953 [Aphanomyces stellatus]